jgi:periplasmic protein TonB
VTSVAQEMNRAASPREELNSALVLVVMMAVSFGLHAFTIWTLPGAERLAWKNQKPVELVMIEVQKPPPPPPPEEEKKPEPPKPKQIKLPPPPVPKEPPPPNDTPPPEKPAAPVPLVVGISMSSTVASGGFAAPVGNTLYGKTSDKAVDASEVKPYAAAKYVPPGTADTDPEVIGEVKIPYPDEAKKNDIEGSVRMKVTVDEHGMVTQVQVMSGPGYGLNEAAREALRHFKFRPATKGGEAVGTTFLYTYTFLLD